MQGPRLYRFFNYEQIHYLPAPIGGWNPDANPWELPETQATALDNFLIRPGKIIMRAPFTAYDQGAGVSPIHMCGYTGGGGQLLVSRKVNSGSAVVDPWFASVVRTNAAGLASASTTLLIASTGAPGSLTVASNKVPGPRSIVFDGYRYNLSYNGTATADFSGSYFMQATVLNSYGSLGSQTATALTNAPQGGIDLKGYLGRIWILGGIDIPGAGTTIRPTALFFTNPIVGGGGSATTDWQDPVSGLTNQLVMDRDITDPGMGLAVVRNGLLILRYSSLWLLRGTTTASFSLQPITRQVGCIDPRSIVETDQGVYFLSERGLMLTDGVNVKNMSGTVMWTLQAAIQSFNAQLGSQAGYATCSLTSMGQIIVSIGTFNPSGSGGVIPAFSAMFDPSNGAWIRLTSAIYETGIDASPITSGQAYLTQLVNVGTGSVYTIGDRYLTVLEQAGVQSFLRPQQQATNGGLYDQIGASTFAAIPALWRTKFVPLVGTNLRRYSIGKRWFIDYSFGAASGLIPTSGWNVQPVDGNSNAVGASTNTPIGGAVDNVNTWAPQGPYVGNPVIQRKSYDFTNELDDLCYSVTWSDIQRTSAPVASVAEIYGIGTEWQKTRDNR